MPNSPDLLKDKIMDYLILHREEDISIKEIAHSLEKDEKVIQKNLEFLSTQGLIDSTLKPKNNYQERLRYSFGFTKINN
jgi:predicted transcriptional regulator